MFYFSNSDSGKTANNLTECFKNYTLKHLQGNANSWYSIKMLASLDGIDCTANLSHQYQPIKKLSRKEKINVV